MVAEATPSILFRRLMTLSSIIRPCGTASSPSHVGRRRLNQREERQQKQCGTDRVSQKDHPRSPAHEQRLTQANLKHPTKDQAHHHRRDGNLHLRHKIPQDTEEQHRRYVEETVVDREGSDDAQDDDGHGQYAIANPYDTDTQACKDHPFQIGRAHV